MRNILKAGLAGLCFTAMIAGNGFAAEVAPADVKFTDDNAIEESLTGAEGDPDSGRELFVARKLGNCLACHENSDVKNELFHGNVGPSLDGAGTRWSEAQLRSIVVNSKKMFTADTVMPGFYSLEVGADLRKDLVGKTILTADQVEDIVAYLATLKE
jgi:sulfur-oxidizing protein SoxX